MVARTRPATLDDLDATPDDGRIYELLNGEIVVSPAPLVRHQTTSKELNYLLSDWVRAGRLGDVYAAPTDVVLRDGNALQPDLFFIAHDSPLDIVRGRFHGVPDLAVEIISPTSRSRDAVAKATRYAREGVLEYWLVDPDLRTVTVYDLYEETYREREAGPDGVVTSGVLNGLTLDPAALFELVDEVIARRRPRD